MRPQRFSGGFLCALPAIVGVLVTAAPSAAQSAGELAACIAIARDADRLACYDAAAAKVSPAARAASEARARESARIAAEEAAVAAAAAKAKAEADAVAAAAARRQAFGAEGVTSRGAARFEPEPGEIIQIEAGIAEILTNRSGLGVFLLDNGQLWRQVDTGRLPNPRVGDRVEVERASLGGYQMRFLRQKQVVRVKRLR